MSQFLDNLLNILISVTVVVWFFLVIYAGATKKSLKESWEDIAGFFGGVVRSKKEKVEETFESIGMGGGFGKIK